VQQPDVKPQYHQKKKKGNEVSLFVQAELLDFIEF
jgi:hypothetical protein